MLTSRFGSLNAPCHAKAKGIGKGKAGKLVS
jgi:hypothetical protein